ncbi:competence protein ComEC, partial [Lecanoromycetidae sp. Uapishka_2]
MSLPPPISKWTFGANIVTPLAQVTVVDGLEGDCNVVDFCHLATKTSASTPPTTVYQNNAWRRTIIDTGPAKGKKGKNIVATLRLLATQQSLPALSTDPTWSQIPAVNELQITHPDDDHVGNAAGFLTAMCTAAYVGNIQRCTVVYSRIPRLYRQPTIIASKAVPYKSTGPAMNECTFTATVTKEWQTLMEKSGFKVVVNLKPQDPLIQNWTLATNGAKWDSATQVDPEGPACTLYYTKTAVDNGLTPQLVAQVTIFLPEQGNLKATTKMSSETIKTKTKKWWESTVSVDKSVQSSLNQQVRMAPAQLPKLKAQKNFVLDWNPSSPIKRKRPSSMLPSKLMSNMVITQPLAGSGNAAVVAGEHIIGSVREVSELSTKITQLNKLPIQPRLKTVTPEEVRPIMTKDLIATSGYQLTIGPSKALYKTMMRTILLNKWALDGIGKLRSPGTQENLDTAATNRSSIVTMFERHDKNPPMDIDATFSMLFTGDAYDKACDIRDTLLSWQSSNIDPTIKVDVLKIPHHGSDNTTSSGFYSFCRANVYLVCGSHCNTHGNPKLSMLEAIVKGFDGKSAPGDQPFRLFFSNPEADEDWVSPNPSKKTKNPAKSKSAVKAILANPYLKPSKPTSPTSFHYEMYKLTNGVDGYTAFGQILFGKDKDNDLVTTWDASQWEQMG